MCNRITNKIYVALLIFWSATFLFSCGGKMSEVAIDRSSIPTMEADSVVMKYSKNGNMSYRFITKRMLRYETKDSIYMVFNRGIYVETYNDSTRKVNSTLIGDSAVFNETKNIWRVNGSVVGKNLDDDITLYTEELFWNADGEKIYSSVESKVIDGEEEVVGLNGFKANQDLSDVVFINSVGRMFLDTTTSESNNVAIVIDTTIVEKGKILDKKDNIKNIPVKK